MANQQNNKNNTNKKAATKKKNTKKAGANKLTTVKKEEYVVEISKKNKELFESESRMAALKRFLALKQEAAANLLWRMSVAKHIADIAEKIEEEEQWQETVSFAHERKAKCLQVLGLDEEEVSFEELLNFRNELRYQYQKKTTDFLKVEAGEAFKALKDKAGLVEACKVYDHCTDRVYGEAWLAERILILLETEEEKNQFGAVKEMGFGYFETSYLKPYYKEIADLFKALMEEKKQETVADKPLAGLADMLREAGRILPETQPEVNPTLEETGKENLYASDKQAYKGLLSEEQQPAEETGKENVCVSDGQSYKAPMPEEATHETGVQNAKSQLPHFKNLTVHEVLAHQDMFASFVEGDMNILLELGNFGYDLNQIMEKKAAISNLLSAVKALGE